MDGYAGSALVTGPAHTVGECAGGRGRGAGWAEGWQHLAGDAD